MTARTSAKTRFNGRIAAAAVTAAAVASAAFGSAPTAGATCASFFGIGGGADCSSTLTTVAVALGQGAQAHADGLAGVALSLGTNAYSFFEDGFSFGVAAGKDSLAASRGYFSIATAIGSGTQAVTSGFPQVTDFAVFNLALNLSPINKGPNFVSVSGIGNVAVNLLGTSDGMVSHSVLSGGFGSIATTIGGKSNSVITFGRFLNTAVNVFGTYNLVSASNQYGFLNSAFQVLGTSNTVAAGPGPLSFAASVFQSNKNIAKSKPGFNINGFKVPNTAAASKPGASRAVGSVGRNAGSAAAARATSDS